MSGVREVIEAQDVPNTKPCYQLDCVVRANILRYSDVILNDAFECDEN